MKYFGGLNRGAVEEYDRDAQETKSAMELLNYQQLNPLDTVSGNIYPSRGNIRAAGGNISIPAFMAGYNYVKPYEDGGILKTQGGNFSNGISYINEGGTHEENPLQGVPMGFDHQGTPNVVEQNETIYDDYVYSNRLHPSKEFMAQYKIASGPHPTFADISKKFGKESAERPNDPISRAGLDVQMRALRDEQERVKAELEARKQQAQNDFLRAMGVDPQEAAMQGQMMEQGIMQDQMAQQQQIAQQQAMQEQAMQEEALRQQLAQEQAMQQEGEEMPVDEYGNPMYAAYGGGLHRYDYGGPVNKFDGEEGNSDLTEQDTDLWKAVVKAFGNVITGKTYKKATHQGKLPSGYGGENDDATTLQSYNATTIEADPDYQNFWHWMYDALHGTEQSQKKATTDILKEITQREDTSTGKKARASDAYSKIFNEEDNLTTDALKYIFGNNVNDSWNWNNVTGVIKDNHPGWFHNFVPGLSYDKSNTTWSYNPNTTGAKTTTATGETGETGTEEKNPTTSYEIPEQVTGKYRPNWLQMVPIYGNLGMVTSDLLGLTNKPKYTEANAILGSIAGPKYISANPRETYYNPKLLDSNWLTNLYNAQRASDMRYAADAAGMRSPGAAIAGRIVANNKYNKSLGELNQQMIEANNKNRLEQAQVGLQNNKNIMDELYKAGAANQSAWNDYADRKLQGTTEAMTQRYKERSDTDLAKGQNLSNLYKSAGNLGDTLFNAMRILELYKTGAFGPMKDETVKGLTGINR